MRPRRPSRPRNPGRFGPCDQGLYDAHQRFSSKYFLLNDTTLVRGRGEGAPAHQDRDYDAGWEAREGIAARRPQFRPTLRLDREAVYIQTESVYQ